MRKVKSRSDLTRLQIDLSEPAEIRSDIPASPQPAPQPILHAPSVDMAPVAAAIRHLGDVQAAAIAEASEQTKMIISGIAAQMKSEQKKPETDLHIDSEVVRDTSGRIKSIKSIVRRNPK